MTGRRGNPIRFVTGIYVGKTGWVDTEREATPHYIHVIVHRVKKKDGSVVDTATKVKKSSVAFTDPGPPQTFAEAILRQQPKIEQTMNKLCRQLAMCGLGGDDVAIHYIFTLKLRAAAQEQYDKGSDAVWKQIDFTPPDSDGGDDTI